MDALEAQSRRNARFPTVIADSGDDLCAQTLQDPQIVDQIVTREYSDESAAVDHRELIDSVPLHLFDGGPGLCVRWRGDELLRRDHYLCHIRRGPR